jgi:hypothetical protein
MSQPALAHLLESGDATVQTRAVILLSSFLTTKPLDVLNSFDSYLPFFLRLLLPGHADSVTRYTLNWLLYRSTKSRSKQINRKAVPSILQYIAAFLCSPPDPERVNAFVRDVFTSQKYIKVVKLLAASGLTNSDFPAMLQILSATGDDQIYGFLQPSTTAITEMVIANPNPLLRFVMRCLFALADKPRISEFAISILNTAVKGRRSSETIRLCFPHLAQIKTHPSYNSSPTLQAIHAEVAKCFAGEEFHPEFDSAPFAILAGVMSAQATFQNVNKNMRWRESDTSPVDLRSAAPSASSLAVLMDEQGVVSVQQQQQQQERVPRAVPLNETGPAQQQRGGSQSPPAAAIRLVETASKKGGKLTREWRKRIFEFSVTNKCLLWRSDHRKDGPKGALLFDSSIHVARADRLLTIKTQTKTHQIQFDKAGTAEIWLNAMKHAIDPKE